MNVDRDGEFGPSREFEAAALGSRRGPVAPGFYWGASGVWPVLDVSSRGLDWFPGV